MGSGPTVTPLGGHRTTTPLTLQASNRSFHTRLEYRSQFVMTLSVTETGSAKTAVAVHLIETYSTGSSLKYTFIPTAGIFIVGTGRLITSRLPKPRLRGLASPENWTAAKLCFVLT